MEIVRQLLAVGTVFGLLGLVVWRWGRVPARLRITGRAVAGRLARTDSLRLTPQHSLHVVSVGPRAWLVSCHPAGASLLAELPPDAERKGAG